MADKRDILIRLLGEETVARMADRAGDGLDRFGDKLDATEKDAKHLDRQIGEVEGDLKALAVAFARTNDAADRVDITKAMRRQQTELRKLTKAKDLLPDLAEEGPSAAVQFVKGFIPALRGALTSGPGAAIGAAAAVALVPTLAAATAGAVLGGVGAGGVVGGLMLAAKDSRVQAAGKALGENVMGDLEDSASRFVEPALRGIEILGRGWSDVADEVDGFFASTSRYVEPLAEGIADMVRELGPGLAEAAAAAGPVIDEIREGLPEVGAALSDMFSTFADHADEGASAIRYLFLLIEEGVDTVSLLVDVFSSVYSTLLDVGLAGAVVADTLLGWIPGFGDIVSGNRDRLEEMKGALDHSGDAGAGAGEKIEGGLRKVDTAASSATVKVETLSEAIARMAGDNISAEQANIRLEEAIDRATEAGKKNNAGIDANTEKGRANRQALIAIAEAANTSATAIYKQTGSQELASQATERGRQKFIESAIAMGVSKKEAIALADKLFAIPKNVGSKVTVTANVQPAIDSAKGVVARINAMHARIKVSAEPSGGYGGSAHTGDGYSTGYSAGGYVHGPGPKGVDSKAAMLAPGEGVLTAAEIDAAGGQAGFERLRAMLRSGQGPGAAAAAAAGGHWGPGPATTSRTVLELRSGGSRLDDLLVEIIRRAIADRGGNVQTVLGR